MKRDPALSLMKRAGKAGVDARNQQSKTAQNAVIEEANMQGKEDNSDYLDNSDLLSALYTTESSPERKAPSFAKEIATQKIVPAPTTLGNGSVKYACLFCGKNVKPKVISNNRSYFIHEDPKNDNCLNDPECMEVLEGYKYLEETIFSKVVSVIREASEMPTPRYRKLFFQHNSEGCIERTVTVLEPAIIRYSETEAYPIYEPEWGRYEQKIKLRNKGSETVIILGFGEQTGNSEEWLPSLSQSSLPLLAVDLHPLLSVLEGTWQNDFWSSTRNFDWMIKELILSKTFSKKWLYHPEQNKLKHDNEDGKKGARSGRQQ